jgi:hypothetical protein
LDFDYVSSVTAELYDIEQFMDYSHPGDLEVYCAHGLDLSGDSTSEEDYRLLRTCVHAVAADLHQSLPFDTSRPCAICGTPGHPFESCPALQDAGEIKKAYIRLRIAVNKIQRNLPSGTNAVLSTSRGVDSDFQADVTKKLASIATTLSRFDFNDDSSSDGSVDYDKEINALSQEQKRFVIKNMSSSDFPKGRR